MQALGCLTTTRPGGGVVVVKAAAAAAAAAAATTTPVRLIRQQQRQCQRQLLGCSSLLRRASGALRQQQTTTVASASAAAVGTAGKRWPGASRPWLPLPFIRSGLGSPRCSVWVSTVAMPRVPPEKATPPPGNEDLNLDNVHMATAEQLKSFFRIKGLPVSGNKTELIARAQLALKSALESREEEEEEEVKEKAEAAVADGKGDVDNDDDAEQKPAKRKKASGRSQKGQAKSDEKAKQQRRDSGSSSKKKAEVSEDDDEVAGDDDDDEKKPAHTSSAKRGKSSKSNDSVDTVPYTVEMRPPRYQGPCLKILSWNVNGLRALLKKDSAAVRTIAAAEDADIVCLQETKIAQKDVTAELKGLLNGYESHWCCADKPGYSGTVLFTRVKPLGVTFGISMPMHDMEGRVITAEYATFYVTNVYIPNAGEGLKRVNYRVEDWDPAISKYISELEKKKPVIMAGDLNIAREDIDIHNPKGNHKTPGFSPQERESARKFLRDGERVDTFRAMHPNAVAFTYWGYRFNSRAKNKGWRLDYFIVSKSLANRVHDSFVLPDVMGSDHCPIGVVIKL